MSLFPRPRLAVLFAAFTLLAVTMASAGDRNPTFQHCLKGCSLSQCDPSQPPIAFWLRWFGWSCEDDCKYQCAQSYTDHVRDGSMWHQFYGKWPFYRLGPIQEPASVLMSIFNLWANLHGVMDLLRRVRPENKLRRWLLAAGVAQINTWFWSTVFHTRDTPFTERMDYFSATLTVALSLVYAVIRVFQLQTPQSTSKLALPALAIIGFFVVSHFTYLLSFPLGQFPYGYHTKFVVILGLITNLLWVIWSLSFEVPYPKMHVGSLTFSFPQPYPPTDPRSKPRPLNAMTPLSLVILTFVAMSFELMDFRPILRIVDAHSIWHACTIGLAVGWWGFFIQDALDVEGASIFRNPAGESSMRGLGLGLEEKISSTNATSRITPSSGLNSYEDGANYRTPVTPAFAQTASLPGPPRAARSPRTPKGDRDD